MEPLKLQVVANSFGVTLNGTFPFRFTVRLNVINDVVVVLLVEDVVLVDDGGAGRGPSPVLTWITEPAP